MHTLSHEFAKYDGEGTVFGSINKAAFEAITFISPTSDLVTEFESLAYSLDQQIERNELESRTLAALRDSLLPKLLSGELGVLEAEELVSGAV